MQLKINEIKIGNRIRKLKDTNVEELVKSIKTIGLLNPITVDRNNNLIAGRHRLEAYKVLGRTKIPVRVMQKLIDPLKLELAEIDENLLGPDLTIMERGEHLSRRKIIYENLYPESKPGNIRATGMNKKLGHNVGAVTAPTFTVDTTKKTGISQRVVQEDIQIAREIDDEVKDMIRDTGIDDSKQDLIEIAKLPKSKQIEVVEKVLDGEVASVKSAVFADRQEEAHKQIVAELPKEKYNVIYADPPWRYEKAVSDSRAVENQYPTMEIGEICDLEVPAGEHCVLFLWVTSPKLIEGLEVIRSWGFKYRSSAVWVKPQIGMGYYVRGQHEFLLISIKGEPKVPIPANRPNSVIHAPRTKHSKKPEEVYEMIERMYPHAKYFEMFARNEREGWSSWGNEI